VRDLIVRLTRDSCGIRDTARVLAISPNTVLQHLRLAAAQLREPLVPAQISDLELDEFWLFVSTKARQRWTWYAWDRQRKKIVAFVHGHRTDASCQQLLSKLRAAYVGTFHTDKWQSYRKYLPAAKHQVGKAGTLRIER
jgi:IS1 family transposase